MSPKIKVNRATNRFVKFWRYDCLALMVKMQYFGTNFEAKKEIQHFLLDLLPHWLSVATQFIGKLKEMLQGYIC